MNTYFEHKKVGIFTAETFPSYAGGGRHAFRLASYLKNMGAYSSIICYNYNGRLKRKEFVQGVRIQRMRYYNRSWLVKVISSIHLILHYFIEAFRNDILIIYGKYLIAYPILVVFGKIFRKKVVYRSTLFGEDDFESLKREAGKFWPILHSVMSGVDSFWAINNNIANSWQLVGASYKLLKMPQCVDESAFYNAYRSKEVCAGGSENKEKLQIISCGILIERKGYRDIFEALSQLEIDYKYTVVGQYNPDVAHRSSITEKMEMKKLYTLGKELLGDRIEFAGTSNNILPYFSRADILLHASETERPNVVLEAMAIGLPVMCRKMIGVEEDVLEDKVNCLFFKKKEELSRLINSLPQRKGELYKIARNASELIAERYSFEKLLFKLAVCLNQRKK